MDTDAGLISVEILLSSALCLQSLLNPTMMKKWTSRCHVMAEKKTANLTRDIVLFFKIKHCYPRTMFNHPTMVSIDGTKVVLEAADDSAEQMWYRGSKSPDGYFTLQNPVSRKFLTAPSPKITTITGN